MIEKKIINIPNNKKIVVYDNIFSLHDSLDIYILLGSLPYFRTNIDLPVAGTNDIDTKFVSNIGPNDRLGQLLFEKYTKNIDELPIADARIMNQYVNYSTPGTVDRLHADATSFHIDPTYTILQYANFRWEVDWHGQTVFYDDDHKEIVFSSVVKPFNPVNPGKYARDITHLNKGLTSRLDKSMGIEWPHGNTKQEVDEGRMAEVDSIIQNIIAGEADPYDVMNHPQGPEEEYVAKILQKEYEAVAIDSRLHPDDDFEQILDRVVDRLAQDYGHQMDEADSPYFTETTVAGSVAPMAGELEEESQWGQAKQDPMNYNAAITGSYYESDDPLARLKTLALSK